MSFWWIILIMKCKQLGIFLQCVLKMGYLRPEVKNHSEKPLILFVFYFSKIIYLCAIEQK